MILICDRRVTQVWCPWTSSDCQTTRSSQSLKESFALSSGLPLFELFVSSLNMPQVAAICFCTASSKTWGMTPNKALLADQWYYILYFVSWSASLNQRKRHHRKGACCWQRQGRLWGSMSIRQGASASWAHIFLYIDSQAWRQCFGWLLTFRKVFDLLVTEGVIQAKLQW